ncbi:MAG: Gfo/Idh/MocA family oxidoreductase [bacterium]|nr:Gfo/Idh/MocA family oxidoreductase [bacterium]
MHAVGVVGLGVSTGFANIIIPQKKKLGVALVGLGYYAGDLLAPALQVTENCELRGVVTGSPWKIPTWKKRYNLKDGNIYNYDNMHEIANNPDIDVIYIVLPTGLHAKYSIIAANTGKHVWCEKPMARTAIECQQIIDACNKNKVKLSIGYRMQHEPKTQELIKWADSKPYGKILNLSANAGYYDGRSDHWKQNKALGGGAMYDMGVYPLNAARYITGEEPISISARHENTRKGIYTEVDETTYFTLNFPSGAVANCSTSLGKGMNDLKVNCQNGWYGLSPFQSYGGIRETTSDGRTLVPTVRNQQARQMDDDALAILNSKEVLVPGEEGMRDIAIVEAAYRSASIGELVRL